MSKTRIKKTPDRFEYCSTVMADEYIAYESTEKVEYNHHIVNHSKGGLFWKKTTIYVPTTASAASAAEIMASKAS